MRSKLPIIFFIIAALVAAAAITLALIYQQLVGMVVFDYNFETFRNTFSR